MSLLNGKGSNVLFIKAEDDFLSFSNDCAICFALCHKIFFIINIFLLFSFCFFVNLILWFAEKNLQSLFFKGQFNFFKILNRLVAFHRKSVYKIKSKNLLKNSKLSNISKAMKMLFFIFIFKKEKNK